MLFRTRAAAIRVDADVHRRRHKIQYRDFEGAEGFFVSPPAKSSFGGVNAFILEWLTFMHGLLALREDLVRQKLVQIIAEAVGLGD
jgi:hypothetical protein